MQYWQLQEAKAKLSELVKLTLQRGPQGISVRGKEECIIISKHDYEKLKGQKKDFLTFVEHSPLKNVNLDVSRDKSPTREITL
jgi:prevent-host-death family protein